SPIPSNIPPYPPLPVVPSNNNCYGYTTGYSYNNSYCGNCPTYNSYNSYYNTCYIHLDSLTTSYLNSVITVTLKGQGFSYQNNTVHFDGTTLTGISSDGTRL